MTRRCRTTFRRRSRGVGEARHVDHALRRAARRSRTAALAKSGQSRPEIGCIVLGPPARHHGVLTPMEPSTTAGRPGTLENPEVRDDVPGHIIPIIEREFDDFDTESQRYLRGEIE